jgi:2-polyprenyl-3-methyl-5-hydroxy-6-metoxy-1,4-benzoquinol methylase
MSKTDSDNNLQEQESIFSTSEDLSLKEIENIYKNVVLKEDFYDESYDQDWHIAPFNDMAKLLSEVFNPKKHLDAGCGIGLLVQAMRTLNIDSFGFDFSEKLINKSKSSIREYLIVTTAEKWIKKTSIEDYDLITFMEVFEHIPISNIIEVLDSLHDVYKGNLFFTIPSHGLDAHFKTGLYVDNGNTQWQRDMVENIPFKNIVLENNKPHCGHITLASYRWWTEFFLYNFYARNRDKEKLCINNYLDIIKKFAWKPYIVENILPSEKLNDALELGVGLDPGWYDYEPGDNGRWTNGTASIFFSGKEFTKPSFCINLATPDLNIMQEWYFIISLDLLIKCPDFRFEWINVFYSQPQTLLEQFA